MTVLFCCILFGFFLSISKMSSVDSMHYSIRLVSSIFCSILVNCTASDSMTMMIIIITGQSNSSKAVLPPSTDNDCNTSVIYACIY